jgi:RimJ/RimL family protein N-acetyltransferase
MPQIIGYVSLCDIYSAYEGKPDTGVLIDPKFQRSGFAREARVAINYLAAKFGLETLFAILEPATHPP